MSKKLGLFILATAIVFTVLSARPNQADAQFRVGPHVGYNFDIEELFIGADIWVGIYRITDSISLHGNPGLSYYFVDEITLLMFDIDVAVLFEIGAIVEPYAGIGLGIGYVSWEGHSDTDLGFNLNGGALFMPDNMFQPFVELRARIEDDSAIEIAGGVLFSF